MNKQNQWLFEAPVVSKATYYSNSELESVSSGRGCVQNCDVLGQSDPACKWSGGGSTRTLPLSGCCRSGFIHNCYSEAFIPKSGLPLHVCVYVNYTTPPSSSVAGREDFSVQVHKCGWFKDGLIGKKRISGSLPDALKFSIASVTPGEKYYINIYSRSSQALDADFHIWQ
jgi:hypothetical protein